MNQSNSSFFKALDILSYLFLAATLILVPLFVDKNLVNFYIIPKEYVFVGLTLVSFLLFAARVALTKQLAFRRTAVDLPILAWLGFNLLSALFSKSIGDSFLGRNEYFVMNFVFLLCGGLFYFLMVHNLRTIKRWYAVLDILVGVGGLTALGFVLKMLFKLDLLSYLIGPAWNTIDKLNSPFGLWLVVILILSAGLLLKKELPVGKSLAYFFVALMSFVSLVLISFNILWWVLLFGLALLLILSVSFIKEVRLGWVSVLFAVFVLAVIFLSFGTPKYFQSVLPSEVSLGLNPSWSVAYHTAFSGVKNFVLGSGPGSFGVDFSRYRPADFNYDSMAWSLRFNQPFNSVLAIFSECGVLALVAFGFLITLVLGHIFSVWYQSRNRAHLSLSDQPNSINGDGLRLDVFLIAVVWALLTGSMFVMFFGPVMWWLWWLSLALLIGGLSFFSDSVSTNQIWEVEDTPQYSLSFSFGLIIVIAAVVIAGVWGARLYMAETDYARALNATDLASAEKYLLSALVQKKNSDVYNAALAQVYLSQAATASQKAGANVQEISLTVANAVNAAKAATDISPSSVAIWENLATMYENASVLVPSARDWTITSLQRAKLLEPTNPVLWWRLGNSYSLQGQWDEAIKNYEQAIKLKSDYLGSYVGLANAYEQKGDINKAIESYKNILPSAGNNPEALFNFGRLIYNRNQKTDRSDAEKIWLEVVKLQPNYSNALYSLGLMYENRGDRSTALDYYYRVKDLNPDNKDVANKIRAMIGESPAPTTAP